MQQLNPMERSRQISPSTRLETSTSYKVDVRGIRADEMLIVTITHAEILSFKEIYEFEGKILQGRSTIHFKWDGKKVIWLGDIKPINKSIEKKSIHSCMNTSITLLAVLFMFSLDGCSESPATPISDTINDLQKYNIKGNVSEIQTITYEPINSANGITAGKEQEYGENSLIKFNEHGYKYIVGRKYSTSSFFLYNEENKLTSQAEVSWDEKENKYIIDSESKFKYANGFLCVDNYINYRDGTNRITVYCNDGRQITNSITYKEGVISSETEYIYEEGEKKEEIIYSYLDSRNGSIDTLTFHHFYHNGFVYKIETSNSICEEIRNENNDIVETTHGKIADMDFVLNVPGNFVYVYEYDEQNNWIKRTEWKKEEDGTLTPWTITTREITYRN